METTKHYKGHRWSTDELKTLMQLWAAGEAVPAIAEKLGATTAAVMKMAVKMRSNGIPLERRKAGVLGYIDSRNQAGNGRGRSM